MQLRVPARSAVIALALAALAGCPPGQGAAPTCEFYCATITANCTGGAAQYDNEAACVAACTANNLTWAVGTNADTTGNTLGCRQYHAGAGANDDHCWHAGPTGGTVCGGYCDVYCDAAMANCAAGNALYTDRNACLAACSVMPDDGTVNAADGDSVQCRLFHLGAAKADPATHCSHAGQSGAGICGDWCEVYCGLMEAHCPDEYADTAACNITCGAFPTTGAVNAAVGNTVQCRVYHAGAAADDTHCDHANAASTADTCQ
ncbi:MAG: hypothetical protein A2138_20815 [Deltaproteobacteria bacterium RBG_16_71_12]|nr:MAG: hypothetical protein A2138_20815 [Deltaproteobacteria bacterium RBG_16_71_12]